MVIAEQYSDMHAVKSANQSEKCQSPEHSPNKVTKEHYQLFRNVGTNNSSAYMTNVRPAAIFVRVRSGREWCDL